MRAFPPAAGAPAVRLTVDEGALVIGLLDFLCEPTTRLSPDVLGVADRTRNRVAAALARAINDGSIELDDRYTELQGIARRTSLLVGTSGPVTIAADDDQLSTLRVALSHHAA